MTISKEKSMSKFKAGDKVERINSDHNHIKRGDVCTVVESYSPLVMELKGIDGTYIPENFKLYEEPKHLYPHHDIVIAWLNGEEIELYMGKKWVSLVLGVKEAKQIPQFRLNIKYRIKPKNPHLDEINSIQKEMDKLSIRLEVLKDV